MDLSSNYLILFILSIFSIFLSTFLFVNILIFRSKNKKKNNAAIPLMFILGLISLIIEVMLFLLHDSEIIMFFILSPIIFFSVTLTLLKGKK